MSQYKVLVDWDVPQTLLEKDLGLPADHITAGTVIELPDNDVTDLLAAGTIELVKPLVEVGKFSINVTWAEGATQEEMDASLGFIGELTNGINDDNENVPAVISQIVIKRN